MSASDNEFVLENEAEQGPDVVRRLREKLKKAIEEKQEYLDGWQRARADFANFKRDELAREEQRDERRIADFVTTLLPALDSFELALKHANTKDLTIVSRQLADALKKLGVDRFGATGEPFDPHLHEALEQKHDGDVVVSVERSGYKINDTIIRPAQVTL